MGYLFLLIGFIIRLIAIRSLNDKSYWRIKPPNKLCTTGIYKYIRNPMYLGSLFNVFGIALIFTDLGTAVIALYIMYAFLMDRIDREEKLLVERFNEVYVDYVNNSKRVMPFIY